MHLANLPASDQPNKVRHPNQISSSSSCGLHSHPWDLHFYCLQILLWQGSKCGWHSLLSPLISHIHLHLLANQKKNSEKVPLLWVQRIQDSTLSLSPYALFVGWHLLDELWVTSWASSPLVDPSFIYGTPPLLQPRPNYILLYNQPKISLTPILIFWHGLSTQFESQMLTYSNTLNSQTPSYKIVCIGSFIQNCLYWKSSSFLIHPQNTFFSVCSCMTALALNLHAVFHHQSDSCWPLEPRKAIGILITWLSYGHPCLPPFIVVFDIFLLFFLMVKRLCNLCFLRPLTVHPVVHLQYTLLSPMAGLLSCWQLKSFH